MERLDVLINRDEEVGEDIHSLFSSEDSKKYYRYRFKADIDKNLDIALWEGVKKDEAPSEIDVAVLVINKN